MQTKYRSLYPFIKIVLITLLIISALLLSSCGTTDNRLVEGKINVITSLYPIYDFTQKIGGEYVNVINLIPAGVDSHDWAPKTQDMADMINADMLIYNGLGFEGWVNQFIRGLSSDSELISVQSSKGIEAKDSIDEEDEHDGYNASKNRDEHDEHSDDELLDYGELDPHVWLSPLKAKKMAENIKDALVQVDESNAASYESNYGVLVAQLDELHHKYEAGIAAAPRRDIVVSHKAFGYLANDYGLNQVGIMSLSPSSVPTPQDMKRITNFIKDNDIQYILFEELVSPKIAQTLADDAHIETLVFNPLEGLTADQAAAGEDYFSIMERNLVSLLKALQ